VQETRPANVISGAPVRHPSDCRETVWNPKLLDRLRGSMCSRHHSQSYCHWVKQFISFNNMRHPADMSKPEINAFLTHFAIKKRVSASTQTQAPSTALGQQ
jgi:hypothetical protein